MSGKSPLYSVSKLLVCLNFLIQTQYTVAQSKTYPDGHGKFISIPNGDYSFADEVVTYIPGNPAPVETHQNPKEALGIPDFNPALANGFVCLGTGGQLVLKFTNNAIINIPGPDIYVFELGKYIEETILSISRNGTDWIEVGRIKGGNSSVDIGSVTEPNAVFNYIKLVDAGTQLFDSISGRKIIDKSFPGADIDAVAAIGSARMFNLNSNYLFDVGKDALKPSSKQELDKVAREINSLGKINIIIEGHTDSTGDKKNNLTLSKRRAESVKKYLQGKITNHKAQFFCRGKADEIPAASNKTEAGRELNRRVEVFLIPQ